MRIENFNLFAIAIETSNACIKLFELNIEATWLIFYIIFYLNRVNPNLISPLVEPSGLIINISTKLLNSINN